MLAEKLNSALDLFKTKLPDLIGIDNRLDVRQARRALRAGKGSYRLERYVIEPLPKDVVTDGNIANLDQVSDALKRAWKRLGYPESSRRPRPAGRDGHHQEDHRTLRPEGRGPRADGRGRGEPVHPVRPRRGQPRLPGAGPGANNPEEVELLIAASRKEKVEDRVAIAESAGLKPRVMDVESYATQEAFRLITPSLPANGRDQNIALVDIGAHITHFYVLRNNQFLFSRDQAFGGNQLTQDIQRRVQPVARGSRSPRRRTRACRRTTTTTCCSRSWRTLALEITRALQFFFTSTSYNQVDQIVLPGRLRDCCPASTSWWPSGQGWPPSSATPFASLQNADRIRPRQLAQDAPLLLIATGLAIRSFE
jgi:type IV pilus assembly protein PilM